MSQALAGWILYALMAAYLFGVLLVIREIRDWERRDIAESRRRIAESRRQDCGVRAQDCGLPTGEHCKRCECTT